MEAPFQIARNLENPMTLVIALFNQDEIMFAADTLVYDYSHHKSPQPIHKIKVVGSHLFASAGTSVGYDICDHLNAVGSSLNTDIDIASGEYFDKTNIAYKERRYDSQNQTASVLFAGFGRHSPQVFHWNLPSRGGLVSNPVGFVSIGALENAANSFARLYHRDAMTTEQRVRLAHFVITRAGESDPRVGNPRDGFPVDVTVLNRSGVRIYTPDELAPFVDSSNTMHVAIQEIFER